MRQIASEEAVIAVIPDEKQEHRLVFLAKSGDLPMPIILRQESYSPGVGWFTQNQIEMTRQQMVMLRASLGTCSGSNYSNKSGRQRGQSDRTRTAQSGNADLVPAVLPFSPGNGRERLGA